MKKRWNYTPEKKVPIRKEQLPDRVPVSDLCDRHGLQPAVFCRWPKEFLQMGAGAFKAPENCPSGRLEKKVSEPEQKRIRKNALRSELIEEQVALRKVLGKSVGYLFRDFYY